MLNIETWTKHHTIFLKVQHILVLRKYERAQNTLWPRSATWFPTDMRAAPFRKPNFVLLYLRRRRWNPVRWSRRWVQCRSNSKKRFRISQASGTRHCLWRSSPICQVRIRFPTTLDWTRRNQGIGNPCQSLGKIKRVQNLIYLASCALCFPACFADPS